MCVGVCVCIYVCVFMCVCVYKKIYLGQILDMYESQAFYSETTEEKESFDDDLLI